MDHNWEEVTETELAVLQLLWDQGASTIGQLADALYPEGTDAHYATVQMLLRRLEEKGHVERDRSNRAHVFSARTPREVLVGQRLRAMAEKLTGGLMGPLLTHLVKAETLSTEERQQLRQLMDELDGKNRQKDKRR
jgi:BlaI family transcriptional regulator, penicillinase repressor